MSRYLRDAPGLILLQFCNKAPDQPLKQITTEHNSLNGNSTEPLNYKANTTICNDRQNATEHNCSHETAAKSVAFKRHN